MSDTQSKLNEIEDKIETLEDSLSGIRKVTPLHDITWYVKWISSFIIVTAMSLRGVEGMQLYDLSLSIIGVSGWLFVGLLWKDRALIILNAVGLFFLIKNLITAIFS